MRDLKNVLLEINGLILKVENQPIYFLVFSAIVCELLLGRVRDASDIRGLRGSGALA